jgi:hypothetical protein
MWRLLLALVLLVAAAPWVALALPTKFTLTTDCEVLGQAETYTGTYRKMRWPADRPHAWLRGDGRAALVLRDGLLVLETIGTRDWYAYTSVADDRGFLVFLAQDNGGRACTATLYRPLPFVLRVRFACDGRFPRLEGVCLRRGGTAYECSGVGHPLTFQLENGQLSVHDPDLPPLVSLDRFELEAHMRFADLPARDHFCWLELRVPALLSRDPTAADRTRASPVAVA